MIYADIGHNSAHALAEENARLRAQKVADDETIATVTRRAETAETSLQEVREDLKLATTENKKFKAENKLLASRNALVEARMRRIDGIYERSDLSLLDKTVATRLITAADFETGEGRVRSDQLLKWTSGSDRRPVLKSISYLEGLRLIEVSAKAVGNRRDHTFKVLPESEMQAEIQTAVDAVRASREQSGASSNQNCEDNSNVRPTRLAPLKRASDAPLSVSNVRPTRLWDSEPSKRASHAPLEVIEPSKPSNVRQAHLWEDQNGEIPHTVSERTPYTKKERKKEDIYNTTHSTEYDAAREGVGGEDALRADDLRELGLSVVGKTVQHANFVISFDAVEMRCLGKATKVEVRAAVMAFALQWAAEIKSGKRPDQVVPQSIVGWIAASLRNSHVQSEVGKVRIDRASKSPQTMPNRHNGSTYARNWRDA